jgi:hypothetical protein
MPIDPFTAGLLTAAGKKLIDYISREQTCEACNRLVWEIYRTGCCSTLVCKRCLDRLDFFQTKCCERVLCRGCISRWLEGDQTRCEYCNKRFNLTQRGTSMIGASNNQGDPRVRRALEQLNCPYTVDEDNDFKISVNLGEGRSQVVFINSDTQSFGDIEIREVYSVGYIEDGEPDERLLKILLRDNGVVKLGAWRLSELRNDRVAFLFAVHLAASADAKTLDSIIDLVAKKADEFEKEFYGTDKY